MEKVAPLTKRETSVTPNVKKFARKVKKYTHTHVALTGLRSFDIIWMVFVVRAHLILFERVSDKLGSLRSTTRR